MADIKQAAGWMREGKLVRRKSWMPDCHSYCADVEDEVIVATRASQYLDGFDVEDLLADDWEIAE